MRLEAHVLAAAACPGSLFAHLRRHALARREVKRRSMQVLTEYKDAELPRVLEATERLEAHLTAAVVSNDPLFTQQACARHAHDRHHMLPWSHLNTKCSIYLDSLRVVCCSGHATWFCWA